MDLNEMMAQAKELQSRVRAAQDSLDDVRVKGLAGNGAVIIEMTGKYNITQITISNDAMNMDAATLAETVKNAFQDAKNKADDIIDQKMTDATGGLDLPF